MERDDPGTAMPAPTTNWISPAGLKPSRLRLNCISTTATTTSAIASSRQTV